MTAAPPDTGLTPDPREKPESGPPGGPASRPAEPSATRPAPNSDFSISKSIFGVSAALVIIAVVLAIMFPTWFSETLGSASGFITDTIGWYYVFVVSLFVVFSLVVAFSKMGRVKLGPDDSKPDFSVLSWFAMLFSAGMGIGLVFWGTAEPLSFYADAGSMPPDMEGAAERELARRAMGQTMLHWGLHAWAIFVIVGLAVAYATHRRGRPVSIRWALEPILRKHTNTWVGDLADILAIVGTICGLATSLGFGVNQIAAGLTHLGLFPDSTLVRIIVVVIITAVTTFSAATGLDKGLKWLSNINMVMAGMLALAVFALGSSVFLLQLFVGSIGVYAQNIVGWSFETFPFMGEEGTSWMSGWTAFYWAWWISWAPFVGVFIARISRGRTVREFIVATLLVPTALSLVWVTVMGGSAIGRMLLDGGDFRQEDGSINAVTALFDMLSGLPAGQLLSGFGIALVTIFFITSADSGAYVVSMISHRGHTVPPALTRIFWAVAFGAIAATLIAAGARSGTDDTGMSALQALSFIAAAPFSIVMLLMAISLWIDLRRDQKADEVYERQLYEQDLYRRFQTQMEADREEVRGPLDSPVAPAVPVGPPWGPGAQHTSADRGRRARGARAQNPPTGTDGDRHQTPSEPKE